jgi:hypothetical protein
MWKKIVANKKAHEDEIVNNAFKIYLESRIWHFELVFQVLPKGPDIQKLQGHKVKKRYKTKKIRPMGDTNCNRVPLPGMVSLEQ